MKYEDLSAAFEFVSFAAPMEHQAYISIDTGTIYWISELNPLEEEVPADLETSDRDVAQPHKNDPDLGSDLALRFAAAELPDRYNIQMEPTLLTLRAIMSPRSAAHLAR